MDPKMDSGYLAPGETLEDEYDVLRTLLPEEVVGIMDQMLCYEVSIHLCFPRTCLMLIEGYLGSMAYGSSIVPNSIYLTLYRSVTMA